MRLLYINKQDKSFHLVELLNQQGVMNHEHSIGDKVAHYAICYVADWVRRVTITYTHRMINIFAKLHIDQIRIITS